MEYSTEQLAAIDRCTDLRRRIVAVSGPAGTGKTTIIRLAADWLRGKARSVTIAAPTGRAARRILEATGIHAQTVHKLLEYGKPEIDEKTGQPKTVTTPSRDRFNPLYYSDVFVDEAAMLNEELYRNLIDALPPGGRLLMFGDDAQLPPIEEYKLQIEGSPFQRAMKLQHAVKLTHVYRQGEESGVLANAVRIRNGAMPIKRLDFTIDTTDTPLLSLRNHIHRALDAGIDYSLLANQIITPSRKGALGVYKLNAILQSIFNPHSIEGLPIPREEWFKEIETRVHVGEKVICNENMYDLRDFFERFTEFNKDDEPVWSSYIPCPDNFMMLNGEIGVISDIHGDGSLSVDFGDRVVEVPSSFRDHIPKFNRIVVRDPRKKLDLAYAVTTHKMQGSECDNVCYVMHRSVGDTLCRNNLYTGITRARKNVHLITDMAALTSSVKLTAEARNDIIRNRKTREGGFKIGDI